MEINRLNELLNDPSLGTREDYQSLKQLAETYPYAQYLRILLAKIAQLLNEDDQVNMLHAAAIYSADRKVLKKLYTQDQYQYVFGPDRITVHEQTLIFSEKKASAAQAESKVDEEVPEGTQHPDEVPWHEEVDLEEVMDNLDKLKALRKQYDQPQADTSEGDPEKAETSENPADLEESTPPENKGGEMPESGVQHHPTDYQKQLIDEFISKLNEEREKRLLPVTGEEVHEDLSSQSTSFDGDLVTETLAKLCVKQGKIDKAIEIYRKLIWKFPQKKAYFAARIEELNG